MRANSRPRDDAMAVDVSVIWLPTLTDDGVLSNRRSTKSGGARHRSNDRVVFAAAPCVFAADSATHPVLLSRCEVGQGVLRALRLFPFVSEVVDRARRGVKRRFMNGAGRPVDRLIRTGIFPPRSTM